MNARGYTIVGKAHGFELTQDADPKKIGSWTKEVAS